MGEKDIREDPDLTPGEKETLIRFAKDEERVHIHTEHAAIVRWLKDHPHYQETTSRCENGTLHATTGTLPLGALKLSGGPRKQNTPSAVVGQIPDGDEK